MDSEVPFREGDILVRKYRLERLLGAGGMGVVYEATQIELDRRVAIKLLRPENSENETTIARVLVEARATARLQSPHVAKLLDVGRLESGAPFLVMEFLQGKNLSDALLADGPRNVGVAVKYSLEVCEALAEAHRLGIVHRDLKPANLFLTRDTYGQPCIKVLDFGISKILDPSGLEGVMLTDSRALIGSPAYMSPEQMRSARDVDQRTDIWSLGAVLFELLTGRPAWTGQSLSELCAQVTRDPSPTLSEACPGIAPELSTIVARCLEKDPANRYQDAADLALALKPFACAEDRETVVRVLQIAGRVTAESVKTTEASSSALRALDPSLLRTLEASVVTASKTKTRSIRMRLLATVFLGGLGVLVSLWLASTRPKAPAAAAMPRVGESTPLSAKVPASAVADATATQSALVSAVPTPPSAEPSMTPEAPSKSAQRDAPPRVAPNPSRSPKRPPRAASSEPVVDLVNIPEKPGHRPPTATTKPLVDPMSIRE
jgi:serine/threonine-protein kinase